MHNKILDQKSSFETLFCLPFRHVKNLKTKHKATVEKIVLASISPEILTNAKNAKKVHKPTLLIHNFCSSIY